MQNKSLKQIFKSIFLYLERFHEQLRFKGTLSQDFQPLFFAHKTFFLGFLYKKVIAIFLLEEKNL